MNLVSNGEELLRQQKILFQDLYNKYSVQPLDEDGYPTDGALELIENWTYEDPTGWLVFIRSIWHLRSWGWSESIAVSESFRKQEVYRYDISTAGWSGNEDIIRAMQKNHILWHETWYSSRRGGHYVFEVEKEDTNEQNS